MVALPVVDQRNTTLQYGGDYPRTNLKLAPRKGVTEQWFEQMQDLLSSQKLTKITSEMRPPTLAEITAMLPGVQDHLVAAVHEAVLTIWWAEATRLYYIVRGSIDISGIYEAKDLATIKTKFCLGDNRHGPQLLKWATSFTDPNSVASQAKLIQEVVNCKLAASCTPATHGPPSTTCSRPILYLAGRQMPPVLSCCVTLRLSRVWRLWSVCVLGVSLVWC